ncbi:MAG TPA: hypothetical protein VIH21_01405 [Dehalococcoidia bacterium]
MQQLSYDPNDPFFAINGWQLGVQIITFENVYGLDPEATRVSTSADGATVTCERLTWGGGQERCPGSARIEVAHTDDGIEVTVDAQLAQAIRCVKLIVRDVPSGEIIGAFWGTSKVPPSGLVLSYPTPLHTPLVFVLPKVGKAAYFGSLDERVRAKRFAFYERDGARFVELIHEGLATEQSAAVQTPPWRIGRTGDPGSIAEAHSRHVERAYGLQAWETRTDVPAWTRDVALVVALHGMHWSGRIFNTYDSMLAALRWITERIDGRRVLAFLPGWEGRYYWQYGDYRPEPRLGGEEGFRRLAGGARDLGVHLMPMFGANCVNANLPGFEEWGRPAVIRSASGLEFQGNRPDWDTARAHDPGWQVWLNPGAPSWRARLVDQIAELVERYDLPAVFLDTQQVWVNDPKYPMFDGLCALRDALKARFPDLLIAGEGWYDALGAVTPVSQAGAPVRWPEVFSRYCRTFQHLSAGDASRGSTGVHELGENRFRLSPDVPYYWPTLTLVDGTIQRAPKAVEQVVAQASRYAEQLP